MLDDIYKGVQSLIDQGRVDAERVCIFGGSYGGSPKQNYRNYGYEAGGYVDLLQRMVARRAEKWSCHAFFMPVWNKKNAAPVATASSV